jgi:acetyl/propionyl-CoA carboxylase alpha subunit
MLAYSKNIPETLYSLIAVDTMRTLIICRGPIAFKTLEVYRSCNWTLPHVVVSGKEWIAYQQCAAPWIANLPHNHVHLIEEYTDADDILQIAKEHHLDAIYPGYGFLAESAEFCERVQQAGFRFIGPAPETLRAVGDKESAIALAKQIGIPTIPGDDVLINFARTHNQEEIREETVRRTLELARRHPGYSIRMKNPVGGGGKGQQVISAEALQATGSLMLWRNYGLKKMCSQTRAMIEKEFCSNLISIGRCIGKYRSLGMAIPWSILQLVTARFKIKVTRNLSRHPCIRG